VSLKGLENKTSAELARLADHYSNCVDGQEESAYSVLEELARRGDAKSAGALAMIYRYKPDPDRNRSVHWAKEAIRLGDPRGKEILEEWRADDRATVKPPAPQSICVSTGGQVRPAVKGKCS